MHRAVWVAIASIVIGLIPFPYNVAVTFTAWMALLHVVESSHPKLSVVLNENESARVKSPQLPVIFGTKLSVLNESESVKQLSVLDEAEYTGMELTADDLATDQKAWEEYDL